MIKHFYVALLNLIYLLSSVESFNIKNAYIVKKGVSLTEISLTINQKSVRNYIATILTIVKFPYLKENNYFSYWNNLRLIKY